MSDSVFRILVALVFIGHGLGHGLAVLPFVGFKLSKTHSAESRILRERVGPGVNRGICLLLFMAALISFVAAGAALAEWGFHGRTWENLALAGSFLSFAGLAIFWDAYPFLFPNKVGVIVVNAATILVILVFRWPASLFS